MGERKENCCVALAKGKNGFFFFFFFFFGLKVGNAFYALHPLRVLRHFFISWNASSCWRIFRLFPCIKRQNTRPYIIVEKNALICPTANSGVYTVSR